MNDSEDAPSNVVATHSADGRVRREELPGPIQQAWDALVETAEGRAQVAAMLEIAPEEVHEGPAPFALEPAPSGWVPPDVIVVVYWTAVNIVVPVLVGLAKDEATARLRRLWRQLVVPEMNDKTNDKTIGTQIT